MTLSMKINKTTCIQFVTINYIPAYDIYYVNLEKLDAKKNKLLVYICEWLSVSCRVHVRFDL